MTLHRPTNLMGTAACHEAGERLANLIAPGTKPLTAEERAAVRKRHEIEKKLVAEQRPLYQMLAGTTRRATQESLKRQADRAFSDLADWVNEYRDVYVGIDTAKPDSEATVIVETREPKRYFWYAPTSEELERAAKLTKWPERYQPLLTTTS